MKSKLFPDWPEDEMKTYLREKYNPADGHDIPFFMNKLGISRKTAYNYLKQAGVQFWKLSEEVTFGNKRTCRVCKKDKPLSAFYKDKTKSKGYKYTCKECYKSRRQK